MTRLALILATLVLCSSCKPADKPAEMQKESTPTSTTPAKTADQVAHERDRNPIAWMHDDYQAALAEAKARNLPLVVDMWAPWCHTCLSMKEFVLKDSSFKAVSERFIWVAIDTDKAVNAAVQTKLPVNVWPTFYVVSPADESIQARYLGAASVSQFREFLTQGEGGHLDATGAKGDLDPKLTAMRDGDRHVVFGRYKEAAASYQKALELGGADWTRRPEVLVARASAMYRGDLFDECTAFTLGHLDQVQSSKTASAADFAYYAHQCAAKTGKKASAEVHAKLTAADGPILAVLNAPDHKLSLDDQSDALHILRDVEESAGNTDKAREWAERQRALLDEAAAKAPNAFASMTYNWPRSEVYVYLGETEKLIPDLEKSVKALPDQYDPPYRLAWLYMNDGEYDKAIEMATAALGKVYGPRKARVLALLADIHKNRGDREAEKKARQDVVSVYQALPEGQKRPTSLERAKKALAAMGDG